MTTLTTPTALPVLTLAVPAADVEAILHTLPHGGDLSPTILELSDHPALGLSGPGLILHAVHRGEVVVLQVVQFPEAAPLPSPEPPDDPDPPPTEEVTMPATLIATLQTDLARLGYAPGRIDGAMGPKTRAALAAAGLEGESLGAAADALAKNIQFEAEDLLLPNHRELRGFASSYPRAWVKPLHSAIQRAHITRERLPAFLAQLAHESAGFRTLTEYATGADYEGRTALGNTEPGDGVRFKGRGPIQITGRANYTRYGALLGEDLVSQPELAERASDEPDIGFGLSALYWTDHNLNALVKAGDFEGLTRAINGGTNGLKDRRDWLHKATRLFDRRAGETPTPAPPKTPRLLTLTPSPAPSPTPPPPAPPSPEPTMANPQPAPAERDRPLVDWLGDLFDRDEERTRKRRSALRATWQEMRTTLRGLYEKMLEELAEEGEDLSEAVDHVLDTFLDVVTEDLAERADQRLDWKRVERAEIRAWLEKHDGRFIRRLLMSARVAAQLRRQRRPTSRLLALVGPVHPVRAPGSAAPSAVVQHTEGAVVDVEPVEHDSDPPDEESARTVVGRLSSLTAEDRRATGRPRSPADLPASVGGER